MTFSSKTHTQTPNSPQLNLLSLPNNSKKNDVVNVVLKRKSLWVYICILFIW